MDLHLSHATLAVRVEKTGKFEHGDPCQRQFHARASTARVRVWQSLNVAGKTGWQGPPAAVFDFRVDAKPQNQYIGVLEYKQTGMNTRSFPGSEAVRADGSMTSSPSPLSLRNCGSESKPISSLRVAYQGVPGAYSEAAASKAYPNCEAVPCDQFEAAFEAVELCQVDRAVLPAENSLGGSIHRNYDLLLRHRLHIVGEVQLAVHHCLLGVSGTKKEDLRRVLSHPQALAQCEHTLVGLGVTRESMGDTAGAAQFVATLNHKDTGAVASYRAAEIYGLDILADGIQDDLENVTRFLMLAREPIIPTNVSSFKTSIVFSLEEGPGVLFKALAVFALRNINLTKIESRPLRKKPLRVGGNTKNGGAKYFDYLFYVDFEASLADAQAQNALRHLSEFATFVRVLGSYPMDLTILQSTNERGGRS